MENGAPHSNTDSSEPSSGGSLVVADRSDPVGMGRFDDDEYDALGDEALAELDALEHSVQTSRPAVPMLRPQFEAHASFGQLCLRGVARRSEPIEVMADDSLSFAAMTAADLVKAELLLAPMPPRPQSSVIDVEVAFSVSVANYCSAGDRIIFTKLDNDECWTVDALGSVISVTAIGDRWGVLLDGRASTEGSSGLAVVLLCSRKGHEAGQQVQRARPIRDGAGRCGHVADPPRHRHQGTEHCHAPQANAGQVLRRHRERPR